MSQPIPKFTQESAGLFCDIARHLYQNFPPIELADMEPEGTPNRADRMHYRDEWTEWKKWKSLAQSVYLATANTASAGHTMIKFLSGEHLPIADLKLAARYQAFVESERREQ